MLHLGTEFRTEVETGGNMAIFAVFLAACVGVLTATYAYLTGDVGIWGAFGLYIAVGWATILSLLLSNAMMRWLQGANRLISHKVGGSDEIMTKSLSPPRKSGV